MCVALLGRESGEDRLEALHRLRVAADHQAVADLEPPDAAGDAGVDEVDPLLRTRRPYRRCESRKFELPPSTIVSPFLGESEQLLEHPPP